VAVVSTPGDPARHSGAWRIGRLAGVPIGIHPLWLVIVGLLTLSLGETWFPNRAPGISKEAAYGLGLLCALLLFAGILLHELGHALVARRRGVQVEEIDLWLLGGVARLRGEPRRPEDELRFASAGPAVTLLVLLVFGVVSLLVTGPDWVRALLAYQVQVNALILAFNLLPAFPLDGGRVLRAALWRATGDRARATAAAAAGGRLFGLAMIALGVLSFASGATGGLWLALIGGFLVVAAGAEAQTSALQTLFAGVRVADLMSRPAVTIPGRLSVENAVAERVLPALYTAYPVEDETGRAVGIVRLEALRSVPPEQRPVRAVSTLADRDPELIIEPATLVTELIARPAFARVGRAAVVTPEGAIAGIISITDLERMRTVRSLQSASDLAPHRDGSRARVAGT
jgi:Zn-dependent protease/CBS domain-containing protein